MKRRDFLKTSGLATAGTVLVPYFLKPFESMARGVMGGSSKSLVVIQLSGGNDGLNTVIPFGQDAYYQLRNTIAVPTNEVIRLNDMQGLNPALQSLRELYDQGWMSILNNVGYPNANRSHFRSMDIWQTASDSSENLSTGWIGRYLDSDCETCRFPYDAIEVDDTLSLAMKGETKKAIAVKNIQQLVANTKDPFFTQAAKTAPSDGHNDLGYLYKTLIETQSSAGYIFEKSKSFKTNSVYPNDAFSRSLKQVAELICAGIETRVYYVSLPGFDTHTAQKGRQDRQLQTYASGVSAFINDLKKNDRLDDVLVITFSEFGRRVAQNASSGTDHGTANAMFLFGGGLKQKGIVNAAPNLSDLEEGDLKHTIDFKNVYATILDKWLQADVSKILSGKKTEMMGFV